ncbi:MAG: putative ABC transporter permease [Bacilli bacterium]|mgnify:FL=1|nr:putative ABC transporter permease [Bacilli bacterium]
MYKEMNKKEENIVLIIQIILISAIFGFIYETIFYRIDLGYFVKRGYTIGPWLPIYATGGLLIYLSNIKNKNNILKIFINSAVMCGLLEFIVGYLLLHISHIRLWDYNTEILNYGNIGGYICLRSVLFFGLSGVFLMNIVLPLITKIINKYQSKKTEYITIFLGGLFCIDFIVNYIIK